jgi:hypothetical protein
MHGAAVLLRGWVFFYIKSYRRLYRDAITSSV